MLKLVALLIMAMMMLMTLLYLMQRSIVFPAPAGNIPADLPAGLEHVPLPQGHALLALPHSGAAPFPLLVFAHGNAELAQWSVDEFEVARRRGLAVLLLEYPGYAGTAGSVSSSSIIQAALEALDQVSDRPDIDHKRIVAYGRSIGSGAACAIARDRAIAALVLESPFYTLKSLVAEKGFPAFLLRDSFDNAAVVASMDIPLLLYHGSRDQIIPIEHSERLRQRASQASLITANCGHNDCPRPWPQVFEFLASHGLIEPGNPQRGL